MSHSSERNPQLTPDEQYLLQKQATADGIKEVAGPALVFCMKAAALLYGIKLFFSWF